MDELINTCSGVKLRICEKILNSDGIVVNRSSSTVKQIQPLTAIILFINFDIMIV
ncbi:MAG: hypothetical protein IJI45_16190 [Anaerolineaceae bacterium]|nr:hypothetical protein [Anaerolineaceae bacterium]